MIWYFSNENGNSDVKWSFQLIVGRIAILVNVKIISDLFVPSHSAPACIMLWVRGHSWAPVQKWAATGDGLEFDGLVFCAV